MDYALLKAVHVTCVGVTFALFVGRGVLMFTDSPLLGARLLRIAPHVIDTLLLASAIWMAVASRQYPFVANWLTAKLIGLIVYIGLGMVALSRKRSKRTCAAAWLAALLVFGYIVGVALTRTPWPLSLPSS